MPDASGKCGDTAVWKVWKSDRLLCIEGNGATYDFESYGDSNGNLISSAGWYPFKNSIAKVKIKDGITIIGEQAFYCNTNCSEIVLGNTVTTVKENAFDYALKKLTLSASVENFDSDAFAKAWYLNEFCVDENNKLFSSVDGILYSADGTRLIAYPGGKMEEEFTVPDGVVEIGKGAFIENRYVKTINLCEGLEIIGDRAFMSSYVSFSVKFPSTLKSIGDSAFESAHIMFAELPEGFEVLGSRAFASNPLQYITISSTTEKIGSRVFNGCNSMQTIYYAGSQAQWNNIEKASDWNFAMTHVGIEFNTVMPGRYYDASGSFSTSVTWKLWEDEGVLMINGHGVIDKNTNFNQKYRTIVKKIYIYDVTEIGSGIFDLFTALEYVSLPNSLTKIGDRAFSGCRLLSGIVIPGSVKEIGMYAFSGCNSLETVSLGYGVEKLMFEAFSGCSSLKSINIPRSVKVIEDGAFAECTALEEIIIPEKVTQIGPRTFSGCTSLSSVTLHDGITSIGDEAFMGCTLLEDFVLPKSLEEITNRTFYDSGISGFNIHPESSTLSLEDGILFSYDKTVLWAYPISNEQTVYTIPQNVTEIKDRAFQYAEYLEEVVFHDGITSIPDYAFYKAGKLKKADLSNIESIGERAFSYAEALTDIGEPTKLITIGDNAFSSCKSIKKITIYESVKSIGEGAFSYCDGVKTILIYKGERTYGTDSLSCGSALSTVYHTGTAEEWADAYRWWNLYNISIFHNYDPNLNGFTGKCGSDISWTLDLESGVLEFKGSGAIDDTDKPWHYVNYIKTLIIGEGITSIGDSAFANCNKLESVYIQGNVSVIGASSFAGCSALTTFDTKCVLVSIGNSAFKSCIGLSEALISDGTKSIGDSAFAYCSGIKEVTIPSSVESVGDSVFIQAKQLEKVTVCEGVKELGSSIFDGCVALKKVIIPQSISILPQKAFKSCSALEEAVLPDSLTEIGGYCFYECNKLVLTELPAELKSIGEYAIYKCDATTSLIIGDKLESIGNNGIYFTNKTAVYYKGTAGQWQGVKKTSLSTINLCCNFDGENYPTYYGSEGYYSWHIYADTSTLKIFGSWSGFSALNAAYSAYADKIKHISLDSSITKIPGKAFKNLSSLEEFTFPEHIETVEGNVFQGCIALKKVDMSASKITSLPQLFDGCTMLNEVILPEGLTEIKSAAFKECKLLEKMILPQSVISIGNSAFYNCTSLNEFVIPQSVESIGRRAFYNCSSLTEIVIPQSVASIEDSAFYNCSSLKEIVMPNSMKSIGSRAFEGCGGLESVVLSDTLESIGDRAFSCCTNLKSIDIPNSVTSIGMNAFSNCTNLKSVVIGTGVTAIEENTFYMCKLLSDITFPNGLKTIGNNSFYECESIEKLTFPNSLEATGNYSFYKCESIKKLEFPEGMKSVGNCAFEACTSLKSLIVPTSIEKIGSSAFSNCSLEAVYYTGEKTQWNNISGAYEISTKKVVFSYKPIDVNFEWSFDENTGTLTLNADGDMSDWTYDTRWLTPWIEYASSIVNVYIDSGITHLGAYSLYGLDYVTNIAVSEENTAYTVADGILYTKDFSELVFYPKTKTETSYTVPNSIARIAESVFEDNNILERVILPDTLTEIPECSFSGCTQLNYVFIPAKVRGINKKAFYNCEKLENFYYGGGMEDWNDIIMASDWSDTKRSVYYYVDANKPFKAYDCVKNSLVWHYYDDEKLLKIFAEGDMPDFTQGYWENRPLSTYANDTEKVEIVGTVTSIGDYTFRHFNNLKQITIPNTVTEIGEGAFYDCSALTEIKIPESVNGIGEKAFYGCSNLIEINISESVNVIGSYAFSNCDNLTTVVIPDSVTEIGAYLFSGCSKLMSVTFPENIDTIPHHTFGYCYALTEYIVPSHIKKISSNAFYNCSCLKKLIIPTTVTELGYEFVPNSLKNVTVCYEGFAGSFSKMYSIPSKAEYTIVYNYNREDGSYGGSMYSDGDNTYWRFYPQASTLEIYGKGETGTHYSSKPVLWENAKKDIKHVVISEGVTNIGNYLFEYHDLESIVIPSSVKEFGYYALGYCYKLKTITYLGTEEQWNQIAKDSSWNSKMGLNVSGGTTILFSDGSSSGDGDNTDKDDNTKIDTDKDNNTGSDPEDNDVKSLKINYGDSDFIEIRATSRRENYDGIVVAAFYKDNTIVSGRRRIHSYKLVNIQHNHAEPREFSFECPGDFDFVTIMWVNSLESMRPLCPSIKLLADDLENGIY